MKRFLKAAAVRVAGRSVCDDPGARVVVLCYHSVHPLKSFRSASPELFEQHLQWLSSHCEVIPFSKIFNALGEKSDRPSVAITFDDGYADNYEYAFPLLQKYGLVATFFVTVGLIEKDSDVVGRFQQQRQSPYEHIRPMDWFQVCEMSKAGIEFGAHTYSHPNLAVLNRPAAGAELRRSKQIMEDRLGRSVTLMAYPFGKPNRHFTPETLDLAAEAGYRYAAAVLWRAVTSEDSQLAVPRMLVARDDQQTLRKKILGAWDIIGAWQEKAPMWLAKMVSPEDFKSVPEIA
jgi:peptidoglycan/xylan/chitin deacetylase (PgdA/CDA1 family)